MTSLDQVLTLAKELGFLGPGATEPHIDHARELAGLIGFWAEPFVDLGSGAGIPAFVLLLQWPPASVVLVEARRRRCEFLGRAIAMLGLSERATIRCDRAETVGRDPELRGGFGLVTARGFGRPAVTAECAAGFLRPGGRLAASEPPSVDNQDPGPDRWPVDRLAEPGFGAAEIRTTGSTSVAIVRATTQPAERWPRRTGIPEKRPLW